MTNEPQYMDTIIMLNRKMVLKEANYYGRYLSGHGVSEDDLVQEGILGLIKAVKRFDYNRGNEFSTYALYWIRQYIMRYIQNHENVVRLPIHRLEQINKLKACEKKLFAVNGKVDVKEVCESLDIPEKLYHELKLYDHCFVCIDSLDKTIGEDDTTMIDMIPDKIAENPVIEEVFSKQLHEQIFALLSKLKKRESEVLKLRYGLDTGDTMTLEEIGKSFNVTRERIRQTESKAIKKLKFYGKRVCLADFR
jgi:RNA polymerase primary sigma factor